MTRTNIIRLLLETAQTEIENIETIYTSNSNAAGIVDMESDFKDATKRVRQLMDAVQELGTGGPIT